MKERGEGRKKGRESSGCVVSKSLVVPGCHRSWQRHELGSQIQRCIEYLLNETAYLSRPRKNCLESIAMDRVHLDFTIGNVKLVPINSPSGSPISIILQLSLKIGRRTFTVVGSAAVGILRLHLFESC